MFSLLDETISDEIISYDDWYVYQTLRQVCFYIIIR